MVNYLKEFRKFLEEQKKTASYTQRVKENDKKMIEKMAKKVREFEDKKKKFAAVEPDLPPLPRIELPEVSTYRSFSGSDLLCFFGDELVGEISGIAYEDTPEGITGNLIFPFFDEELRGSLESLKSSKLFDILLVFLNDQGNGAVSMLKDAEVFSWSYEFSMDDIVFEISAKFRAKQVFPFKNLPKMLKEHPIVLDADKELTLTEVINNDEYRAQYVQKLKDLIND